MFTYPDVSDTLANDALRSLQDLFSNRGQALTPTTIKAFKNTFQTMQTNLSSRLAFQARKFQLVSLDPGMGKTDAVCSFIRAWKAHQFMPAGGVVVCLSRKAEIDDYITRTELEETEYAVWTADDDLNAKGLQSRQEAPVLFTTQQMVRTTCWRGSFEAEEAFHYQGRPRNLRIWDESILLDEPAAVRLDTCTSLLAPLRPIAPYLAEAIDAFAVAVDERGPGKTITAPQCLNVAVSRLPKAEKTKAVLALKTMAGQEVLISSDPRKGLLLVHLQKPLPEDLAPMIVLDASGRVRETYRMWEQHRPDLVVIAEAPGDYRNLIVNHWDRTGSRSAFSDAEDRSLVLKTVADLIAADDNQKAQWLVIHYKGNDKMCVESELKQLVVNNPARLHFRHWGNHHGTNDFRGIDRVVVLGLNHKERWVDDALIWSVTGRPADGAEQQRAMRLGEHRHDLLQAICRSSVREHRGGVCGPCQVYLIGQTGSDMKALLETTFPGCRVAQWKPVAKQLTGRAEQVVDALMEAFANPLVQVVRKSVIRVAVGFKNRQGLAQVLRLPALQAFLCDLGITMTTRDFKRIQPMCEVPVVLV